MDIRSIHVEGDSYKAGFQHGKAAAAEIARNFQYYMSTWLSGKGKSERGILDRAVRFLPFIEELNPEYVKELRGVADGAGVPIDMVLALNSRWELNYSYLPDMNSDADGGCTAFALTSEASKDGHTYVGQNWDYKPPLQGQCIALSVKIPGRPKVFMFTEAGIIGHKGFSSTGIGLGVNFIKLKRDAEGLGVPFLIKARHVLEQTSLDSCVAFLAAHNGPNSGNMLIASREGGALDIESNPTGLRILKPQQGVLVHSNHFQLLGKDDVDIGSQLLPDTFSRTARLSAHFHDGNQGSDLTRIEEGLRDHTGFPNSICRHENIDVPEALRWQTLVSFFVDLTTGTVHFTGGPPCKSIYSVSSL